MKTEFEATILDINKEEFIKTLKDIGAKKEGDYFFRRYVYDMIPDVEDKWVRLRTDGNKTMLAIKHVVDETIWGGTKELEMEVADFEKMNLILNEMGYIAKGYQENKRIVYILDDVEIAIDTWPMIPSYVEVEGESKDAVYKMLNRLNINRSDVCALNTSTIYQKYGIDFFKYKKLKFNEKE